MNDVARKAEENKAKPKAKTRRSPSPNHYITRILKKSLVDFEDTVQIQRLHQKLNDVNKHCLKIHDSILTLESLFNTFSSNLEKHEKQVNKLNKLLKVNILALILVLMALGMVML